MTSDINNSISDLYDICFMNEPNSVSDNKQGNIKPKFIDLTMNTYANNFTSIRERTYDSFFENVDRNKRKIILSSKNKKDLIVRIDDFYKALPKLSKYNTTLILKVRKYELENNRKEKIYYGSVFGTSFSILLSLDTLLITICTTFGEWIALIVINLIFGICIFVFYIRYREITKHEIDLIKKYLSKLK